MSQDVLAVLGNISLLVTLQRSSGAVLMNVPISEIHLDGQTQQTLFAHPSHNAIPLRWPKNTHLSSQANQQQVLGRWGWYRLLVQPYRCSDAVVSMVTMFSSRFPARNHYTHHGRIVVCISYRVNSGARTGSNDLPESRPAATTFSRVRRSHGFCPDGSVSCLRCVRTGRRPLSIGRLCASIVFVLSRAA